MMDLSFLSEDINYPEELLVAKSKKRESTVYSAPEGLAIRVYATGDVRVGKQLIEENLLDFQPKGAEMKGNGIDFVYSKKWSMFRELFTTKKDLDILFFAFVPREEGYIDLFQRCKYQEETGEPIGNVAEGTKSLELLAILTEMGVFAHGNYAELKKGELYVDFTISNAAVFPYAKYYNVEKIITRGENVGKFQNITRENVVYYAGVMTVSPAMQLILDNSREAIAEPVLEPVLNSPPAEVEVEDEDATSELRQELELNPEGLEEFDEEDEVSSPWEDDENDENGIELDEEDEDDLDDLGDLD